MRTESTTVYRERTGGTRDRRLICVPSHATSAYLDDEGDVQEDEQVGDREASKWRRHGVAHGNVRTSREPLDVGLIAGFVISSSAAETRT